MSLSAPISTTTTVNFNPETQTVAQSPSDNGKYNSFDHKSEEDFTRKRSYDSSRNEAQPTKKMSFSENDFYAAGSPDRASSRQENSQRLKLSETEMQNEEKLKKMFSKRFDADNGLQKTPFLGFNGGETVNDLNYYNVKSKKYFLMIRI